MTLDKGWYVDREGGSDVWFETFATMPSSESIFVVYRKDGQTLVDYKESWTKRYRAPIDYSDTGLLIGR